MGKLLSFYGHKQGGGFATGKTELGALEDEFDALVRTLRMLLTFVDQIEVKLEQLDDCYPNQVLRDRFEDQRTAIAAEISRVYRDVSSLKFMKII